MDFREQRFKKCRTILAWRSSGVAPRRRSGTGRKPWDESHGYHHAIAPRWPTADRPCLGVILFMFFRRLSAVFLVAERPTDGSRGFQPTDHGLVWERRRIATVDMVGRNRSTEVAANCSEREQTGRRVFSAALA